MIPILFEHDATSFNSFGIGALKDTSSCEVTEERNGKYELVLKYPLRGKLINEIQKERIVYVKVNDFNSKQAFRIYRITKPISGIITVYAQHISYDLSGVVVFPCNFDSSNPMQIMSFISQRRVDRPTNFTFYSDITNTTKLTVENPRTFRNVLGGQEESLTSHFNGEFEWDNFQVKYLYSRGGDHGVTILYGKNMTKLEHNSDITGVYTHLCPYAVIKDGDTTTYLELPEKVLSIITTLAERKTLIMDFSSFFGTGEGKLEPTVANLRQVANEYLTQNILGIETPNITLSFEELRGQLGYSNLHETISLCDVVTVKYSGLDINVKTKIVKVVYDSLKEKYKSVTLGAIKASLNDTIVSIEKEIDDSNKELKEVPDHIKKAVDAATDMITGANGGNVVLDLNNDKKPYELLIMDTDSKETATKLWRWNMGGLGYSSHGYNGPYSTAITSNGEIVADFITTGTLTADIIKAGTIEALNGDSYWDLESGDLSITGDINATSGVFHNVTIYGDLYLSGTETVPIYGTDASVTYSSVVGGQGIDSDVFVTPSGGSQHKSQSRTRPFGIITVPENYASYANDHMMIGVCENFTYSEDSLLSGVYLSHTHLGSDEYKSRMVLKTGDQVCFETDYYKNAGGDWTSKTTVGLHDGTTDIRGKEVTFFHSVARIEAYTHGSEYPQTDPIFVGHWYFDAQVCFGRDNWLPGQLYIRNDAIAFSYNNRFVGMLVTNDGYVNIQGTWRTNGNSWISSSDEKLKNTIEELDDRYSVLFNNLKPRSYKFNDGTSGRKHTGLIAQEVIEAMNKANISLEDYGLVCAFGDPKDPKTEWGIRYEELIALCIKEIQKLNKRVEELEEKK